MDAIDELVARSKPHPELEKFHGYHRAHPEVLDFLAAEIQLRIDGGHPAFSYRSLWEYARWKLVMRRGPGDPFKMNDHLISFYSRAITILHPEFNGLAEIRACRSSEVDKIFGVEFEPRSGTRPRYARRLMWADGTVLENGWRPKVPHVPGEVNNRRPDIHDRDAA